MAGDSESGGGTCQTKRRKKSRASHGNTVTLGEVRFLNVFLFGRLYFVYYLKQGFFGQFEEKLNGHIIINSISDLNKKRPELSEKRPELSAQYSVQMPQKGTKN